MHKGLVKFALLLQNGGQIRMGGGKLGENFQSFQVECRRLFNESLFPLDVGQVIERIRVIGTQSEIDNI